LYFVQWAGCFNRLTPYNDKKVVGVFVRFFRVPLQQPRCRGGTCSPLNAVSLRSAGISNRGRAGWQTAFDLVK
jgi:hypothetical protein